MESMITSGSSWSCFTPLASYFENAISSSPIFQCLVIGCPTWILLTYLWWVFHKYLNDPLVTRPPLIILISLTVVLALFCSSSFLLLFCFSFPLFLWWWSLLTNFVTSPSVSTLQFVPSDLCIFLYSGRDLCGNSNTSSNIIYEATSLRASATSDLGRP